MAVVWSLATVGSGLAANYGQLFLARFLIGVGEAAYGSVGLALVLAVFAANRRASLTGAFMAGGSFGSVLGVAFGGVLAVQFGWRWAFGAMGALGLILAAFYLGLINERKLAKYKIEDIQGEGGRVEAGKRARLRTLFSTPSVVFAYLGSGLQLFITGALFAWLPSFFNREYGMAPDRAGGVAGVFILIIGVGMIVCGMITDRVTKVKPARAWTTAVVFAALSVVLLVGAFTVKPGGGQMLLLALGSFFAAGTTGPTGAMVARLTHESIRATAFGTLTFFNNLLGLAAGPLIAGAIADRVGLDSALRYGSLVSVLAIVAFLLGRKLFPSSLKRLAGQG
jgi:MFS family permease